MISVTSIPIPRCLLFFVFILLATANCVPSLQAGNISDPQSSYTYTYDKSAQLPLYYGDSMCMTGDTADPNVVLYFHRNQSPSVMLRFNLSSQLFLPSVDFTTNYTRWGFTSFYPLKMLSINSTVLAISIMTGMVLVDPSSGIWLSAWKTDCRYGSFALDVTNYRAVCSYGRRLQTISLSDGRVLNSTEVRQSHESRPVAYHAALNAWIFVLEARLLFYQADTLTLIETIELGNWVRFIRQLVVDAYGSVIFSEYFNSLCVYYLNATSIDPVQCILPGTHVNTDGNSGIALRANGGLIVLTEPWMILAYSPTDITMPLFDRPVCLVADSHALNSISSSTLSSSRYGGVAAMTLSTDRLYPDIVYYMLNDDLVVRVFNVTAGAELRTLGYRGNMGSFYRMQSVNASLLAVFGPSTMTLINLADDTYRSFFSEVSYYSAMTVDASTDRGCWIVMNNSGTFIETFSLSTGATVMSAPFRTRDTVHGVQFHSVLNNIYVLTSRNVDGADHVADDNWSTRLHEVDGETFVTKRSIDVSGCWPSQAEFFVDVSTNTFILSSAPHGICFYSLLNASIISCWQQPGQAQVHPSRISLGTSHRLATTNVSSPIHIALWDLQSIIPIRLSSSSSSAGAHSTSSTSSFPSTTTSFASSESRSSSSVEPISLSFSSSSSSSARTRSSSSSLGTSSSTLAPASLATVAPSSSSAPSPVGSSSSSWHPPQPSSSSSHPEPSSSSVSHLSSSGVDASESKNDSDGNSLSIGSIVGIALGTVFGIVLMLAAVWLRFRCCSKLSKPEEQSFVEMRGLSSNEMD